MAEAHARLADGRDGYRWRILLVVLFLGGCSSSGAPPAEFPTSTVNVTADPSLIQEPAEPPSPEPEAIGETALVARVIDGDTVEVVLGGTLLDVRLIGIDTPETAHPSEPVECMGGAASRFTRKSLEGQLVQLEFDVERLDRYGRTLAYVWLGEQLFNETLVARGFAYVGTYPPNVKYVDRFLAAQRQARVNDEGLWGALCAQENS